MPVTAAGLPPVLPSDRALRDPEAPSRYDLAQTIASLRAENHSLREQLRAQDARLALYRDIDEAADVTRGAQ